MYPYLKKDLRLHYLENSGFIIGDNINCILNEIEVYILDKINGEKTIDDLTDEITIELNADDKFEIKSIVKKFIEDWKRIINISSTPNKNTIRTTGVKGKKYPINVILSLTNKCNLTCIHCYKSCSSKNNDFIPYDKLISTLNFLKGNTLNLQLTGGEPMLHSEFFKILNLSKKNFQTTITTAATLINETNVHHFHGVKDVQVSLYSYNKHEHESVTLTKGSYDRTINGINLLVQNEIPLTVSTIITKGNIDKLEDMIKFLINLKVKKMAIGIFSKVGRGLTSSDEWTITKAEKDEVTSIINDMGYKYKDSITISKWVNRENDLNCDNEVEGLSCGAGLSIWTISEKGNIKPCDFFPDDLFSFGNIIENNIEDIINNYSLNSLPKNILKWHKKLNMNNRSLLDICDMIENYRINNCQ